MYMYVNMHSSCYILSYITSYVDKNNACSCPICMYDICIYVGGYIYHIPFTINTTVTITLIEQSSILLEQPGFTLLL